GYEPRAGRERYGTSASARWCAPFARARLPWTEVPVASGRRRGEEKERGTLHRTGLPALSARAHEALPQGRSLFQGEVRDRAPGLSARPTRTAARTPCRRLRHP